MDTTSIIGMASATGAGLAAPPCASGASMAVIGIARSLELRVVAEGVETVAQLNYLRRHRCHETQGYLFSPPLAAAELTRLLEENRKITFENDAMPERTLLIVDDEILTKPWDDKLLREHIREAFWRYEAAHGEGDPASH